MLVVIASLVLAAVFVTAGVAKLRDLSGSREAMEGFGVPAYLVAPLGFAVPLAELTLAVALLIGPTRTWGALGAMGLLAGFSLAIAWNLARGRTPDCHCFGNLHSSPAGPTTLARNAGLIALAAVVATQADPAWSAAAAAAGLAFAAAGWALSRRETPADSDGEPQRLPIGAPAPSFELPAIEGQAVSLQSLLGLGMAGRHQRELGEGADAQRRRQRRAAQRHLLGGVGGVEAVPGPAPAAGAAVSARRPPGDDDVVAGGDAGDTVAHRLDHPGGLVAQQEREVVVDPALAVVEVGVAYAAGLHPDERLSGPGVGNRNRLDRDRRLLGRGHHAPHLMGHLPPPLSSSGSGDCTSARKARSPGRMTPGRGTVGRWRSDGSEVAVAHFDTGSGEAQVVARSALEIRAGVAVGAIEDVVARSRRRAGSPPRHRRCCRCPGRRTSSHPPPARGGCRHPTRRRSGRPRRRR